MPDAPDQRWVRVRKDVRGLSPSGLTVAGASQGLWAGLARVRPEFLADDLPLWPFLTRLPVLPAAVRTRWHGTNYLYAVIQGDLARLRQWSRAAQVAPGHWGVLEHHIEHLYINGRRGVSCIRAAEGEAATLSREAPFGSEPACTSLVDILRTFAPALDVTAALEAGEPVELALEAEAVDIVLPTLAVIGLDAAPA